MQTDRPVGVGVLGCGTWGRNHARTLAGLGALAALADADADRAGACALELGCRAMTPEALIAAPEIDAVVLAMPPDLHARTALAALAAGKHVLVEKPMALNLAEAEAIVAAARRTGLVAMTGHLLRFHPAFEALEALMAAGELGRLQYVHSIRVGLGRFFTGADALWDIAPHDLSMLLALTGEFPARVHMESAGLISDAPDFAHLHLGFPSGVRAHVFISRLSPIRDRKLTVIGSKAMAVFDDSETEGRKLALYRHRVWTEEGQIRFENAAAEHVATPARLPLEAELDHFIGSIRAGTPPRASVAEGLDTLRILALAEAGQAQGAALPDPGRTARHDAT